MDVTIIILDMCGRKSTLILNKNMTIGEAKMLYGRGDPQWKFEGKILKNEKTLLDYDIEDDDIITSNDRSGGGGLGGFGLNTIDVSKNNVTTLELSYDGPFYRRVGYGLNIQAVCGNDCETKDKEVYCPIGFVDDYDILQNLENIRCPACNNEIYPKNFWFWECKYKIDYTKWENNKKESGTVEGEAGEKFKIFSEYSGNANFSKLLFNVTRK